MPTPRFLFSLLLIIVAFVGVASTDLFQVSAATVAMDGPELALSGK